MQKLNAYVFSLKGTPTSIILSNQDNEVNLTHGVKDYVKHELVPILTMDPNCSSSQMHLKGNTAVTLSSLGIASIGLNAITMSVESSQLESSLQPSLVSTQTFNPELGLTSVYTLAEEPELEAQETQLEAD